MTNNGNHGLIKWRCHGHRRRITIKKGTIGYNGDNGDSMVTMAIKFRYIGGINGETKIGDLLAPSHWSASLSVVTIATNAQWITIIVIESPLSPLLPMTPVAPFSHCYHLQNPKEKGSSSE